MYNTKLILYLLLLRTVKYLILIDYHSIFQIKQTQKSVMNILFDQTLA